MKGRRHTDGSDTDDRVHRVRLRDPESVVTDLVHAIAEFLDADPLELDPLYDYVEPSILEGLVGASRRCTGDVIIDYDDARITVDDSGTAVIRPVDQKNDTQDPPQ